MIVELDGRQHGTEAAVAYDLERTEYLGACGYRVIRFANWEVMRERPRVLDAIVHACQAPRPKR